MKLFLPRWWFPKRSSCPCLYPVSVCLILLERRQFTRPKYCPSCLIWTTVDWPTLDLDGKGTARAALSSWCFTACRNICTCCPLSPAVAPSRQNPARRDFSPANHLRSPSGHLDAMRQLDPDTNPKLSSPLSLSPSLDKNHVRTLLYKLDPSSSSTISTTSLLRHRRDPSANSSSLSPLLPQSPVLGTSKVASTNYARPQPVDRTASSQQP